MGGNILFFILFYFPSTLSCLVLSSHQQYILYHSTYPIHILYKNQNTFYYIFQKLYNIEKSIKTNDDLSKFIFLYFIKFKRNISIGGKMVAKNKPFNRTVYF